MARTRTLLELRDEVRQRADMENSELIADAELTRYINQSIARLHGKIAQAGEGDFEAQDNIPTTVGGFQFALNADFWRLAAVPPYLSIGGKAHFLRRFTPAERPHLLTATDGADPWSDAGGQLYYRLVDDDTIEFLPPATRVTTVTVTYVRAAPALAADADTYDGRNGWDEWVVLDAAVKCLMKEESDVRALIAERDALWEEIKPQAAAKDLVEPDRVRDVEGGW
jgi:hypothetical protein